MQLYIKIDSDFNIIDHPILEVNLKYVHPEHNFDNGPPPGYAKFERIPQPTSPSPYQRVGEVEYIWDTNIVRDNWPIIDLTNEEIFALQDQVKASWAERFAADNPSFIFDEITCTFIPPVPKPLVGKWVWRESDLTWVSLPAKPDDGKRYYFDLESEQWIVEEE